MDSSLVASIVISSIAIVPGILAFVNQAKRDKLQTNIDTSKTESEVNKIAQEAAVAIIEPLTEEVQRLQKRVSELEQALIDKTLEIGRLMQQAIEKDTKIALLEHQVSELKAKLKEFEDRRRKKSTNLENIETKFEEDLLEIEHKKKEEINNHTIESIKQLTNGSISGNINITEE